MVCCAFAGITRLLVLVMREVHYLIPLSCFLEARGFVFVLNIVLVYSMVIGFIVAFVPLGVTRHHSPNGL